MTTRLTYSPRWRPRCSNSNGARTTSLLLRLLRLSACYGPRITSAHLYSAHGHVHAHLARHGAATHPTGGRSPPAPLSETEAYLLSWDAASERLLDAASLQVCEASAHRARS